MGRIQTLLAATLAASAALAPTAAEACGGFFCSSQPVDQEAERILFVEEADDEWSVYVEIMYQGEADAFAWLLPVPEVPRLDLWYGPAFNALDQLTQPVWQPDWQCFGPEAAFDGAAGGAPPAPAPNDEDRGPDVLAREQVGPFDTVTIQSNDPRATVEWLRENGFRIVPAMEPFIALYSAEGMKFTAMKLLPGEAVDSIKPVKLTYRSANPMIPLRLTSVAALPEMGIKVWVLAKQRFGPTNVPGFEVTEDEVTFDYNRWTDNYLAVVARKVDDLAAPGFATEFAQPTEAYAQQIADSFVPDFAGQEAIDARDSLAALLRSRPYLTRMYTRLSPEEMGFDPIFEPHTGPDYSNIHQLPPPPEGQDCGGGVPEVDACAFATCGAAGRCAAVGGEAVAFGSTGCACAPGAVARSLPDPTAPFGQRTSCVDLRLNFLSDPNLAPVTGNLALPDPCTADLCGANGECVALNGSPTCRCADGFIAAIQADDAGQPVQRCVAPAEPVPAEFYLTKLAEPALPYPGKPAAPTGGGGVTAQGCSAFEGGAASLFLVALFGLPLVRRRRAGEA